MMSLQISTYLNPLKPLITRRSRVRIPSPAMLTKGLQIAGPFMEGPQSLRFGSRVPLTGTKSTTGLAPRDGRGRRRQERERAVELKPTYYIQVVIAFLRCRPRAGDSYHHSRMRATRRHTDAPASQ